MSAPGRPEDESRNAEHEGSRMSEAVEPLRIDGELSIYRAAELCDTLKATLAALPAGADLAIDLAGVTEMDSAGVQLLIAARSSAAAAGHALSLRDPSPAVREVLDTLRLAPLFAPAA
jgi:anti-sigma B factor antagonist